MKHELKDLDQFFEAARHEAPVVDDSDVLALLGKADAQKVVGTTEVMTNSPISRILSALKHQQGATIMTGLGLTAVTGILVTGYLLSSPEQPTVNVVPKQAQVAASVLQQEATEPTIAATAVESTQPEATDFRAPEPATPPAVPQPAVSIDSSLWANVKIETVKPLIATPQQVEELGVNKEPDGKVYLLRPLGDMDGLKMRLTFPPPTFENRSENAPTKEAGLVAPVFPTMVTDAKGKKLAFYFEHKSEMPGLQVMQHSSVQRHDDGLPNSGEATSDIPSWAYGGTSESSVSIELDQEGDEYELTINSEDGVQIETPSKRSKITVKTPKLPRLPNMPVPPPAPPMPHISVMHMDSMNFNFDFKFDTNVYKFNFPENFDFKFDFQFDSSDFDPVEFREKFELMKYKFNADSIRKLAEGSAAEARRIYRDAAKIRINADSIRRHVMEQIEKMPLDTTRNFGPRVRKTLNIERNIIINRDSTDVHHMDELPRPIAIFDIRPQYEMIDKLIPVEVLQANEALTYNKNGLIFWYMPDQKFEEKAPQSLRDAVSIFEDTPKDDQPQEKLAVASKSGAIAEPSLFPNPSRGASTFKYTLAEPRAVSIAIHDLLGKRVMMVSEQELKSSGTFEKELDLASLEAGVYLLVMVTDKGEQITQRLVIED